MLNKNLLMNCKKAQVASTTTWIVATIIIIVILLIFFYASNILAVQTLSLDVKKFVVSLDFENEFNFLDTKSIVAYLQTSEGVKKSAAENWMNTQDVDVGDYLE